MKLLLHCCCGPCATACVEDLIEEGITPTLFWYNPNIHPLAEYQNRRDGLMTLAAGKNLQTEIIDTYGLKTFLIAIGGGTGNEAEMPGRCETCYRMRLEKTAAHAAENGFDTFSTTLLISPYQRHDLIRSIGEQLAARYRITFLYRDFRPLFRQGQNQARALGLYMQKYCGCIFSEEENYRPCVKKAINNPAASSGVCCFGKVFVSGYIPLFRPKGRGMYPPHTITPEHDNNSNKKTTGAVNPLFQRLALLAGEDVLEKLARTTVLIVGAGGVGSWCAEALVRSGVGKIGLVDFDTICASNVNRQVQATSRTLGKLKVEVLKQRLLEINPDCQVSAWNTMFSREDATEFNIEKNDYVIDAIDTMPHKLDLIEASRAAGVTLFSSMGMARKMNPTRIKTADIWETQGCPLARLVRQGLRKRGFTGSFTAVYSDEPVERNGSAAPVTAAAGMVLASLVLRDIAERL